MKTKRINFEKPTMGGSCHGAELTCNPGNPSTPTLGATVSVVGLDSRMKPKSIVQVPLEDLDELIQSLLVIQQDMGVDGLNSVARDAAEALDDVCVEGSEVTHVKAQKLASRLRKSVGARTPNFRARDSIIQVVDDKAKDAKKKGAKR